VAVNFIFVTAILSITEIWSTFSYIFSSDHCVNDTEISTSPENTTTTSFLNNHWETLSIENFKPLLNNSCADEILSSVFTLNVNVLHCFPVLHGKISKDLNNQSCGV
jgi:hypothetical protein